MILVDEATFQSFPGVSLLEGDRGDVGWSAHDSGTVVVEGADRSIRGRGEHQQGYRLMVTEDSVHNQFAAAFGDVWRALQTGDSDPDRADNLSGKRHVIAALKSLIRVARK